MHSTFRAKVDLICKKKKKNTHQADKEANLLLRIKQGYVEKRQITPQTNVKIDTKYQYKLVITNPVLCLIETVLLQGNTSSQSLQRTTDNEQLLWRRGESRSNDVLKQNGLL